MSRRGLTAGDVILWGLVAVVFAIALTCVGCASSGGDPCAGCPPRLEVQEVDVPTPCIVQLGQLPPLVLPPLPKYPGPGAPPEAVKAWLADLRATIAKREALLEERVRSESSRIAVHDAQRPTCDEIR